MPGVLLFLFLFTLRAQELVRPDDAHSVAESFIPRTGEGALACRVSQLPPVLNFSFRFQSGYHAELPLRQFEGEAQELQFALRVTAENRKEPVYLLQTVAAPGLPGRARGSIEVSGAFSLGEGSYDVAIAIHDNKGRFYRRNWSITAERGKRDQSISVPLPEGAVGPLIVQDWEGTPGINAGDRRLTVLLHAAPMLPGHTYFGLFDRALLLNSLASLLDQTSFRSARVVAFNLDQQRILFSSDAFDAQGFRELSSALNGLNLQTVSVGVLKNTSGYANILSKLSQRELNRRSRSDAVVFLGPATHYMGKARVPPREREKPQFFYFEYKPYWRRVAELPDVIASLVHALRGKIIIIHTPHDFANAIGVLERTGEAPAR